MSLTNPVAAIDETAVSIDDIRFASQIGSVPAWNGTDSGVGGVHPSAIAPPPGAFRGTSGASCSGVDLDVFLHRFDPRELLAQLQQSVLAGAQAQVSNYLLALAYSAPTLASVLDMSDRQLHARFASFSQTCSGQQAHAAVSDRPEQRMALAVDQCFASEVARGASPTEALRRCGSARDFETLAVPAALTTLQFLQQHSDLAITPRVKALLELIPDERIVAGNYQVRAPQTGLPTLLGALQARSRLALDRALDGAPSASVAECAPESIADPAGSACLPRSALALVDSAAFRGARMLGPAALSIFKDALSRQIAVTATYTDLLDLGEKIANMNLRDGSSAGAEELLSRQRSLQDQVMRLIAQAELQRKLQQARLEMARTQLLALERSRTDLQARSNALASARERPIFGVGGLLQLIQDRR
ncbi:MAG: hypothetical protein JO133_06935 [Burkholderiaceae bacterium]|nr:hypothetical protein [Burkholderiaceae bacterium]